MHLTSALALCIAAGGAPAKAASGSPTKAYAQVLAGTVSKGRVDYGALRSGPLREQLDAYLKHVATSKAPEGRSERIAFYVNAYNALVLRSVVEHGMPRSVLDVEGFFKTETHTVSGREVTLDQLEKQILNPFAKDPRTHFVLVCGAVGCPILETRPYTGQDLSARMDRATRRYLSNPHGARVRPGKLELSKIFDWYASDFSGPGGVRTFVLDHLDEARKRELGDTYEVSFLEYDWSLNRQR